MTRRHAQWQSLWLAAVLKRSRTRSAAKEVRLSSALRSRCQKSLNHQRSLKNQKNLSNQRSPKNLRSLRNQRSLKNLHRPRNQLRNPLLHRRFQGTRHRSTQGHVVVNAIKGLVEAHVTMVMADQLPIVNLMEGQCMIVGVVVDVAAKEVVIMCVDAIMFMITTPLHAESCEGKILSKNTDAHWRLLDSKYH